MIGTIVNTGTILAGSLLGSLLRRGIQEKYRSALYNAMGLAATGLGINAVVQNMPNSAFPVLFILSLALGSFVGTVLDLDGGFQRLTARFSSGNLGQGLSTGILLNVLGGVGAAGAVSLGGAAANLVLATLGNVAGGVLVGLAYWYAYRGREAR